MASQNAKKMAKEFLQNVEVISQKLGEKIR